MALSKHKAMDLLRQRISPFPTLPPLLRREPSAKDSGSPPPPCPQDGSTTAREPPGIGTPMAPAGCRLISNRSRLDHRLDRFLVTPGIPFRRGTTISTWLTGPRMP